MIKADGKINNISNYKINDFKIIGSSQILIWYNARHPFNLDDLAIKISNDLASGNHYLVNHMLSWRATQLNYIKLYLRYVGVRGKYLIEHHLFDVNLINQIISYL